MVIVKFCGGFANQLFQYAMYLRIQEQFPEAQVWADVSHYETNNDHGGFKLGKLVEIKYLNVEQPRKSVYVNEDKFEKFCKKYKPRKDYHFEAYWQNPMFFPKDMSAILHIFENVDSNIKSNPSHANNLSLLNQISQSNSVSIHVRRGDYVNHPLHGNITTKEYYQNAIRLVRETNLDEGNLTFFVFSDDIEWAKANLEFGNVKAVYVEGNERNVEYDMYLMSCCKDNIIANSSFSWWAQYLNKNANKKVYMPEKWFNNPNIKQWLTVEDGIRVASY